MCRIEKETILVKPGSERHAFALYGARWLGGDQGSDTDRRIAVAGVATGAEAAFVVVAADAVLAVVVQQVAAVWHVVGGIVVMEFVLPTSFK